MGDVKPLRNVSPCHAFHDIADDGLMNTVAVCDSLLRHSWVQATNGLHVLFGELREMVCFAKWVVSFSSPIGVVVGLCANEQVHRVAARRVVAAMQDVLIWWQRAMNTFVRQAVCTELSAFFIADDSVTVSICSAGPWPASIWLALVKVEQETIGERDEAGTITARFRAVTSSFTTWWQQSAVGTQLHGLSIHQMEYVN